MMRKMGSVVLMLTVLAAFGAARADSLFTPAAAKKGTLIANKNRFEVGDIITVTVKEMVDSSVTANTNTKKESTVDAQAPVASNGFLTNSTKGSLNVMSEYKLPNWDIQAKNEHKARGDTRRSAELNTTVACLVTQVMENGNLMIQGERNLGMNREDCSLLVTGVIRARDVSPANTINSTQIANATILLKGSGPLWNNQRRGLVTKVLDWFSPF